MTKEEYISYLYRVHNAPFASDQVFLELLNIENNLTDKMYSFLVDNKIELDYKTLNIFCQTNKTIELFHKSIKKSYHKDYIDYIKRLKDLAKRIQYYSENQIKIILPKFALNDSTVLYIFVKYLESKDYGEHTIKSIKKFFNKQRLKSPTRPIQKEIVAYSTDEIYMPNIKLSHINILSDFNITQHDGNTMKTKAILYKQYIESLDDLFNNYRKKFSDIDYLSCIDLNSKYDIEEIHYWDINTNEGALFLIKKYITYDIYSHLKNYDDLKMDIFTLFRFIMSVHSYKLTKYENYSPDDMTFYNLNQNDNTKFRSQLNTLKSNADKLLCYSTSSFLLDLPIPTNENIYSLVLHLQERGIDDETIDNIREIFYDKSIKPPLTDYIKAKEEILDSCQSELMQQYQKHRGTILIKDLFAEYDMWYTPKPCDDEKISIHKIYTDEIKKLLSFIGTT